MILAPRWALSAQAIDAVGSPHLAPGIHLRVMPSPLLGFPMAPFMIYRANLGPGAQEWKPREEITWTTLDGQQLKPPIQVTPDRPVVGHLPPPQTEGSCIWIEVLASPEKSDGLTGPIIRPGPLPLPKTVLHPQLTPTPIPDGPTSPSKPLSQVSNRILPSRLREVVIPGIRSYSLKVEAQVYGTYGPSTVASRSVPPYQLGASRIERVLVTGRGSIEGVRWLSDASLDRVQWEPWRLLGLPLEKGARYFGAPNAEGEAKDRVHRGAPLLLGLHDDPSAADPTAAPPASPSDEWSRVEAASSDVLDYVQMVIDDTSAPQTELQHQQTVFQDGDPKGDVSVPVVAAMLQFGLDPGVGRYLGLCECDDNPLSTTPGDVVVYGIRALWSLDLKSLGEKVKWLPEKAISDQFPEVEFGKERVPADKPWAAEGPYMDLWSFAATTIGAPPDAPAALALETPINGNWVPSTPPDALRELALPLGGAMPAAGLAVARHIDGKFVPLNREDRVGRRHLIFLGQDPEQKEPGAGAFWDGSAPPDPFAYRVAQSDWFGRWSAWREVTVPQKERPRPPRPVLQATYIQPAVTLPVSDTPLSGMIRVRVEVPQPDAMAPGSHLLSRLELTMNGSTSSHPLASPSAPGPTLEISLPGPALARAATGTAVLTGRWVDSTATPSLPSEPVDLTLYDPRPAAQLTFPNTLTYTSRPDVTGKARAVLTWTPGPGHKGYRVYAADETGVRARLAAIAADGSDPDWADAAAVLARLNDLSAPDRAARYRNNRQLLRREAFELLTGDPLPAAGLQMRYEHAVSGSLRVLMLYRVVPVTAAGVESNFEEAPLLTFGVPNSGAPSTPELSVRPAVDLAADAPYTAVLSVRVPRGSVPAGRYRVRRSSVATLEPLTMPIIATGTVAAPDPGSDQSFIYLDQGPWVDVAPTMRLKPWFTYYYGVEVQAPPEPGSTVAGDWSPLSPVVAAQLIPPNPPAAATNLTVANLGAATRIRFNHPEVLAGGAVGPYQVQIYRQPATGRETLLTTLPGDATDGAGWFQFDDAAPERTGARYRVLVIDPIGRRGAPTAPAGL